MCQWYPHVASSAPFSHLGAPVKASHSAPAACTRAACTSAVCTPAAYTPAEMPLSVFRSVSSRSGEHRWQAMLCSVHM